MRKQPGHNGKVGLFGSCSGGRHAVIYASQRKDVSFPQRDRNLSHDLHLGTPNGELLESEEGHRLAAAHVPR